MSPPPSRRQFLALCGAGVSTSLAGCSTTTPDDTSTASATPEPVEGLVWRKSIVVELGRTEPSTSAEVLRLQFDPDSGEAFGAFDPAYAEGVIDDASVVVPSDVHDALSVEFGRVSYDIAMGPVNDAGDHLHAATHRTAFNELPLAGRATVEQFWERRSEDLRVGYLRPIRTDPPDESPSVRELGHLDLGTVGESY